VAGQSTAVESRVRHGLVSIGISDLKITLRALSVFAWGRNGVLENTCNLRMVYFWKRCHLYSIRHQFRKSPAEWNAQPVNTLHLQCRVTGSTRSGAGPFRSPVAYVVELFTGSSPWFNTEFWQFSRKHLKTRNYLWVVKHIKCSRKSSRFCAIKIHGWHSLKFTLFLYQRLNFSRCKFMNVDCVTR